MISNFLMMQYVLKVLADIAVCTLRCEQNHQEPFVLCVHCCVNTTFIYTWFLVVLLTLQCTHSYVSKYLSERKNLHLVFLPFSTWVPYCLFSTVMADSRNKIPN